MLPHSPPMTYLLVEKMIHIYRVAAASHALHNQAPSSSSSSQQQRGAPHHASPSPSASPSGSSKWSVFSPEKEGGITASTDSASSTTQSLPQLLPISPGGSEQFDDEHLSWAQLRQLSVLCFLWLLQQSFVSAGLLAEYDISPIELEALRVRFEGS